MASQGVLRTHGIRPGRHGLNCRDHAVASRSVAPPRFENREALLLASLSGRYRAETVVGIPALWQRFDPHTGMGEVEVWIPVKA